MFLLFDPKKPNILDLPQPWSLDSLYITVVGSSTMDYRNETQLLVLPYICENYKSQQKTSTGSACRIISLFTWTPLIQWFRLYQILSPDHFHQYVKRLFHLSKIIQKMDIFRLQLHPLKALLPTRCHKSAQPSLIGLLLPRYSRCRRAIGPFPTQWRTCVNGTGK